MFDDDLDFGDESGDAIGENSTMVRNLKNMKSDAEDILAMDDKTRKDKLKGMDWADDHISTSADDAEEVADFLTTEGNPCWDGYEKVKGKKDYEEGSCTKKVSESITDMLKESKKISTFVDKSIIKDKLRLMENIDPIVEPQPITKPNVKPVRPMRETDRPFLPKRKDKVKPRPKAEDNGMITDVDNE